MSVAKDFLRSIKHYDDLINSQITEQKNLEEMITRITPVLRNDGGSPSGNQDKIGSAIAKIVDLQEDINKNVDTYVDLKKKAHEYLKLMKNPAYSTILHKRYFRYESLQEIAEGIGCSKSKIKYLHGYALQEYEKVMKERA